MPNCAPPVDQSRTFEAPKGTDYRSDTATLKQSLDQRKPSAFEMGSPLNREEFASETPSKPGEGFLKASKSAEPPSPRALGRTLVLRNPAKK